MGKKASKTKLVKANLEAEMEQERDGPKSPSNSDSDEPVDMNDVQRRTPSPAKPSTARKAVAPPKKTPSRKRTPTPDDEGDDSEISVANDEYRTQNYSHSPREVKQSHTMPQFDAQDANANLEAFEELLYTVEIEEELVHRELVRKTQTHSNEEKKAERCLLPDDIISSESQTASMSKLEIQSVIIPKAKQEEIYNYVWYSKMRTCEREKNLEGLQCHKIVEM